ncbi:hypothetical protein N6H18_06460 [Reichenbachiella agarivorans]|uniref:PorZ N-terminal beta-propeller domain-containing protein n=1 Tax=Reichenbachiella agarivorans TaxID=2979464 RepID=A0ABY6CUC6_9BACT|nr:hypothetical protein [Reichenbachiella agarivorans]UXP33595.1 hypothetical protein N6H18_06460 [Reichenbachiella agarivorans]
MKILTPKEMLDVKKLVFVLVMLISQMTQAQELIPMGTWRTHYNYQQSYLVEEVGDKIFASYIHGLLYFDSEDQSLNKVTKIDGLSGEVITAMAFDAENSRLILGYRDGNIDYIEGHVISNVRTLIESSVVDEKTIRDISFYKGKANLATDFGLLVLEPESGLIRDSYRNLGPAGEVLLVNQSAVLDDAIYLATPDGVLKGLLNSGDNLQDFNNWERFEGSLVENENVISVTISNGQVYAATQSKLFVLKDQWTEIVLTVPGLEISKIRGFDQHLLVISLGSIYQLDTDGHLQVLSTVGEMANDALMTQEGILWSADGIQGLLSHENDTPVSFVPQGPVANEFYALDFIEDQIIALPTLDLDANTRLSNGKGYSVFKGGQWQEVLPNDMAGITNIAAVASFSDSDYSASFSSGFYDMSSAVLYDDTNSPLMRDVDGNVLVSGLAVDFQHGLWIANISSNPLIHMDQNGDFDTYSFDGLQSIEPASLTRDSYGQLWMPLGLSGGNGLLIFDPSTLSERYVSASNSDIPSDQINDLTVSMDQEMWIATTSGLAYFPYIYGVTSNSAADLILPTMNGEVLFEDEEVYAVAIDGGNRKWVSSSTGVYLLSATLSEIILHFNTSNSPIPSNKVTDIAINQGTGEVFFGTDHGMISYRSDAIWMSLDQTVAIYPNPVLPHYQGQVGFKGLPNNALLKITTVSGSLVREIQGYGTAASWDTRDYTGRAVDTGVYLVFSATQSGLDTYVGKIAVIK